MTRLRRDNPLLAKQALLITESREEFDRLVENLADEIRPQDTIERMYVDDIARLTWDVLRYHRCKAALINLELSSALTSILWLSAGYEREQAADLAERWFTDKKARQEVLEALENVHLDESAIESKAMQNCAAELEQFEKLLMWAELRRNKALRSIAEYRGVFARQLRQSSDRIVDGKALPIEHKGAEKAASEAA